jgi:hypothetical protein
LDALERDRLLMVLTETKANGIIDPV